MVRYKKFIGAAAGLALAFSTTAGAAAGSAAVSSQASAPVPATEIVDSDANLRRTGILIPLALITAISLAIYFLLLKKDKSEPPISA